MAIAAPLFAEPSTAEPFTLEHFREWAAELILDSDDHLVLDEFEEAFIEDVFAGYPECWLIVPEENGKTTLLSVLALYHSEFRTLAAVPVAASSREQAEILYKQGEGFVLRTPSLHAPAHSDIQLAKGKRKTLVPRFVCLEGYRRINHFRGGRIQVFAADDRTGDGVMPTLGIIDEPHRMRDMSLYRTWSGKLRKRGGQIVLISTAGEPGSEFESTREQIRQTATEVTRRPGFGRFVSESVVMHEYAVAEDANVEDMKVVKASNPSPRITVESLRTKFDSPTMTLPHWRRFVCNLPTRSELAAVTEVEWEAAKVDPAAGEPTEIPEGEPIDVGIDPAWKLDTFAIVPLWLRDEHFGLFGPASVTVPPRDGTSIHPDEPMVALTKIHERNPIRTVVMDTSAAVDFAHRIETELGVTVADRPQTNPLAAHDFAVFMSWLRNHWLKHTGDADLTRHVLNAIARELPGGGFRFDRPHRSRTGDQAMRVIDALSAASMVLAFATATPEAEEAPTPFVLFGGRQS